MEANGPDGIKCWQFGLNFTRHKFKEDVMEYLGARVDLLVDLNGYMWHFGMTGLSLN